MYTPEVGPSDEAGLLFGLPLWTEPLVGPTRQGRGMICSTPPRSGISTVWWHKLKPNNNNHISPEMKYHCFRLSSSRSSVPFQFV